MSGPSSAPEGSAGEALERSCPSARCEPGATLLGIVNADGRVGYITPPLQIDDEFVQRARQGREPEKRFRFADTCVETGCQQWTGSRCGVIDAVLAADAAPAAAGATPATAGATPAAAGTVPAAADTVPATGCAALAAGGADHGTAASLPRCAIRSTCQWFAQSGADACRVCPLVVTEPTAVGGARAGAR